MRVLTRSIAGSVAGKNPAIAGNVAGMIPMRLSVEHQQNAPDFPMPFHALGGEKPPKGSAAPPGQHAKAGRKKRPIPDRMAYLDIKLSPIIWHTLSARERYLSTSSSPSKKSTINNRQSSLINQSPSTRKTLKNKIQSAFENKAEPPTSFSISAFPFSASQRLFPHGRFHPAEALRGHVPHPRPEYKTGTRLAIHATPPRLSIHRQRPA